MLAYDLGCKGITIFRDGSKESVLQVGTPAKATSLKQKIVKPIINQPLISSTMEPQRNVLEPRKRATVTRGYTYEVKTEQGDLYITINEDDKGIFEIFLNLGKSGSFTAGYTEALGRLISMSLRSGIKPDLIVKQLQGIRTSSPTLNKGMIVYSVPDAIAKILKKHIDEMQKQIELMPDVQTPALEEKIIVPEPVLVNTEIKISKPLENLKPEESVKVFTSEAPEVSTETHTSKYTRSNEFGGLLECPDCGGDLEYSEGCILCRSCGYSKCG
jgi:ribonucleoside-diphosphate reductase alpha chain